MIPAGDLFESHLTVADLQRSMTFFGRVLGFELAEVFPERRVAFYWIGHGGDRGGHMRAKWCRQFKTHIRVFERQRRIRRPARAAREG